MIISVDTETTGLDIFHGCRPFMISACDGNYNYLWEGQVNGWTREVTWKQEDLQEAIDLMESATTIVFHNAQFDIRALSAIGCWKDHWWDKIQDTQIISHALCSGDTHGLKDLAVKYLHYWDDDEEELNQEVVYQRQLTPEIKAKKGHPHFPALKNSKFYKMDFWMAPTLCRKYAKGDAERTFLLYHCFRYGVSYYSLQDVIARRTKLIRVLYDMQSYGINFDLPSAIQWLNKAKEEMERIRKQIQVSAKVPYRLDLNKKSHLVALLYDRLKLPIYKKTKTGPSTDKHTLKLIELEHSDVEEVKLLRQWRTINKRVDYVNSYLLWCDADGIIHSGYNVTGTRETRQSSSSPNLQNVNKFLRKFFPNLPGHVRFSLDLVNIELRIWAYETNNPDLIAIFERNESVHLIIYEVLFPEDIADAKIIAGDKWADEIKDGKYAKKYTDVKGGTFSRIYGATEKKSNQTYGKSNACELINKRFPGIKEYMEGLGREVLRNADKGYGPCLFTRGGYRLDVDPDKIYTAANYRIQGTAGEMIGDMMIALYEHPWNGRRWNMCSQVHDSLDLDIPNRFANQETYDEIIRVLEEVGTRFIPTCKMDYKIK